MFRKIFKTILSLSIFTFLLFYSERAFAETNKLPDFLVGQTTIYSINDGSYYYGGMTGNSAVLNYNTDKYGLDSSLLTSGSCQDIPLPISPCFVFGNYLSGYNIFTSMSSSGRLLTGRTSVTDSAGNTKVLLETPALFYGKRVIVGDTATPTAPYSNFAYWGKNLAQSGGAGTIPATNGASWGLSSYTFNNNSQLSWTSADFNEFSEKIDTLAVNGTTISSPFSSAGSPLYLQNGATPANILTAGTDAARYPEGRVWVITGDVAIPANTEIKYHGVGTIIIMPNATAGTGNLTINSGAKLIPNNPAVDKLGIIVYNDVTLNGSNKLTASVFCKDTITLPDTANNVELRGAFVANDFAINQNAPNNISFFYDQNYETRIPPGFKYLKLPTSMETGN